MTESRDLVGSGDARDARTLEILGQLDALDRQIEEARPTSARVLVASAFALGSLSLMYATGVGLVWLVLVAAVLLAAYSLPLLTLRDLKARSKCLVDELGSDME